MPNEIPKLEAYTAAQFQRKTGCSDLHARGFYCEVFGKTASQSAIMTARKKPAHCSEVRWRIELRRRKQMKELGMRYYDGLTARGNRNT